MDTAEYLAFVPLLLFGMALADLFGQWRRFVDPAQFYWLYCLTTVMFTEWAIDTVFRYEQVVQELSGASYVEYWLQLIQPLMFVMMVSALTPDDGETSTKDHFAKRVRVVFAICSVFLLLQMLPRFGMTTEFDPIRMAAFVVSASIAVTRKLWLINVLGVVWLAGVLQML